LGAFEIASNPLYLATVRGAQHIRIRFNLPVGNIILYEDPVLVVMLPYAQRQSGQHMHFFRTFILSITEENNVFTAQEWDLGFVHFKKGR
jgi:hypothetical protein